MKKLSILVLISLGLVLGISCSKEKNQPEEDSPVSGMTFNADLSSTKSVFADNESTSLVWTGGEWVTVMSFPAAWLSDLGSFDENYACKTRCGITINYPYQNQATLRTQMDRKDFVGGDDGNDSDEYCFLAVFPENQNDLLDFAPFTGEQNEHFWRCFVREDQDNASYGSHQILYDADFAPTDGEHTNTHIYTRGDILNTGVVNFDNFRPATSMIRFNMATDDDKEYSISKIVIRSKSGATLSGKAGLMSDGSGARAWNSLMPSDPDILNYSYITLKFDQAITVGPTAGDWYHAVVIPGEVSGKISFTAFDENGYRVLYAEKDAPTGGFKAGVRHKVSLTMGEPILPEDALSGQFSISENAKAYIAKGNLWAYIKNGVRDESKGRNGWMIAANQYDIVGKYNYEDFDSYEGLIDLFGFSSNNNDHGIPVISGAVETTDYIGIGTGWTDCMAAKGWRTITADEGVYLFTERTNAMSLFAYATVYVGSENNPIRGLVFLPDNWTTPEGCSFTPVTEIGYNFSVNTYKAEDATAGSCGTWEAMEENGAVFWPCAGVRIGTNVATSREDVGDYVGAYWSGTEDEHNTQYGKLLLYGGSLFNPHEYPRSYGACVRLVRDVTEE